MRVNPLLFFLALLFIPLGLNALPVGNPGEASLLNSGVCNNCYCENRIWSLRLGYYGDFIFNVHMEVDSKDMHASNIRQTQIFTNAAYFALNFCNRVDIFATLGASNIYIITPDSSFNFPRNVDAEVFTETNFSWSVGLRGTIWECGCFILGGEFQYFATNPEMNFFKRENSSFFTNYFDGDEMNYRAWQIGLGAAYQVSLTQSGTSLIPYLAVTWENNDLDMHNTPVQAANPVETGVLPNLKNGRNWGYAAGISLVSCDMACLTLEGRFVNETSLYVNGQIRF